MSALAADARRGCIAATVRADVRALSRYPVAKADGWIKLDAMENPYPLPGAVHDALDDGDARRANQPLSGRGRRMPSRRRCASRCGCPEKPH